MSKQLMIFVLLVLAPCFFSQTACGQATDSTTQTADSAQKGDNRSVIGKVALGAFAATAIPIALATVLVDVFSSAGNLVVENGSANYGISFETGVGFGEREKIGRYPDYRIQLQYSYFPNRDNPMLLHLMYDYDVRLFPVDKRQLFTIGFSPGIGVLSDFHSQGIAAELSLSVMHPSLFYIGFIPQHNVYFRLRYNYLLNPARGVGEVSAGISSTFTFGK